MSSGLDASVLVLNKNYVAIHVVGARRAFGLLCRERAEVVTQAGDEWNTYNFTSWIELSQARHLFAVELRRVAGIEAASHALGHSDLSTTLGIYGHFDMSDLEQAMERYAAWTATPIVSPDEPAENG